MIVTESAFTDVSLASEDNDDPDDHDGHFDHDDYEVKRRDVVMFRLWQYLFFRVHVFKSLLNLTSTD